MIEDRFDDRNLSRQVQLGPLNGERFPIACQPSKRIGAGETANPTLILFDPLNNRLLGGQPFPAINQGLSEHRRKFVEPCPILADQPHQLRRLTIGLRFTSERTGEVWSVEPEQHSGSHQLLERLGNNGHLPAPVMVRPRLAHITAGLGAVLVDPT